MVLPLSKGEEERKTILLEQLVLHAKGVVDKVQRNAKNIDSHLIQYILQDSAAVWQYAKALQNLHRMKEGEEKEDGSTS